MNKRDRRYRDVHSQWVVHPRMAPPTTDQNARHACGERVRCPPRSWTARRPGRPVGTAPLAARRAPASAPAPAPAPAPRNPDSGRRLPGRRLFPQGARRRASGPAPPPPKPAQHLRQTPRTQGPARYTHTPPGASGSGRRQEAGVHAPLRHPVKREHAPYGAGSQAVSSASSGEETRGNTPDQPPETETETETRNETPDRTPGAGRAAKLLTTRRATSPAQACS